MLVDAANKRVREQLDPQIIKILKQNQQLPSILVLNKVSVRVCAHAGVNAYVCEYVHAYGILVSIYI